MYERMHKTFHANHAHRKKTPKYAKHRYGKHIEKKVAQQAHEKHAHLRESNGWCGQPLKYCNA